MKRNLLISMVIIACISLFHSTLMAQDKASPKFGEIALQDFDLSKHSFDSGASAVIIADIGNSTFEGNNKADFSIIFNHFKRVKILNKMGLDAATVEIPLYTDGKNEEKVRSLKAFTYNLENGQIVKTALDEKSVFTDKANRHFVIKKFTFPAVKDGSIIEFSYTLSSDFIFNLQPWAFQGNYPELWSEYTVGIPEYLDYVILTQGYQPFLTRSATQKPAHYRVHSGNATNNFNKDEALLLEGTLTENHWVMKDVPALKAEKFTTTTANYISKVEFQLSKISYPGEIPNTVMKDWNVVSTDLMGDEHFGSDLTKLNSWLDDELAVITANTPGKLAKARQIYAFVRDHFSCTGNDGIFKTDPLSTVFKKKSGTEAELNLLLTAMMRHERIEADPVILSVRDNGFANKIYPMLDKFDYVICAVTLDSMAYVLDASQPRLGFGHLPDYCYNGFSVLINSSQPVPLSLDADTLKEETATTVFIMNDEQIQGLISGSVQSSLGFIESYNLREKFAKKDKKELFKEIRSAYPDDVVFENLAIDSLTQPDYPVRIKYEFSYKRPENADHIYFNPFISSAYRENPFKSAERKYPVEMPYRTNETYVLNMEIPKGYEVEELPKSAKVSFNENEGFFEYLIEKNDTRIMLRSRLRIERANFSPEDYNSLRDFFGFIVNKQSEQIVFKKKK